MSGCCSKCGTNGPCSRTCCQSSAVTGGGGSGSGEIMLFGVRVKVDLMRKSVSLNNLTQYEQSHEAAANNGATSNADALAAGYASADEAVNRQSSGGRERKREVPWTEEEHKLFLLGLQKVGKGDWRGISRNFVKSRTPTQVASHAQKYFLRRNNLTRRCRRSTVFDITTDSVTAIPMEEEQACQDDTKQPDLPLQPLRTTQSSSIDGFLSESATISGFPVANFTMTTCPILLPVHIENPMENLILGQSGQVNNASTVVVCSVPLLPVHNASAVTDPSLDQKSTTGPLPLSLKLSLSSDQNRPSSGYTLHFS